MQEKDFKKIHSLEQAYQTWQSGDLDEKYLKRASRLQCECGNADPLCMQSDHTKMADEMFRAGDEWERERHV